MGGIFLYHGGCGARRESHLFATVTEEIREGFFLRSNLMSLHGGGSYSGAPCISVNFSRKSSSDIRTSSSDSS